MSCRTECFQGRQYIVQFFEFDTLRAVLSPGPACRESPGYAASRQTQREPKLKKFDRQRSPFPSPPLSRGKLPSPAVPHRCPALSVYAHTLAAGLSRRQEWGLVASQLIALIPPAQSSQRCRPRPRPFSRTRRLRPRTSPTRSRRRARSSPRLTRMWVRSR